MRLHDLRYARYAEPVGLAHYMQVSMWLGHESFVTTLTIYADYIDTEEGGKAVLLARPTAPAPAPIEEKTPSNVVEFRRRIG